MNASERISTFNLDNTKQKRLSEVIMVIKSIKPIANIHERKKLLERLSSTDKTLVISFINAHALNLAWDSHDFSDVLYRSDVLLKDGIGISLLSKFLGINSGINMNGTDFIPEITKVFAGKRVAVCGTKEPYLSLAVAKIKELGAEVIMSRDGFQPPATFISEIKNSNPDLVILGMGMPKQEEVSMLLAEHADYPMIIVNGGAILDFWANRFPRAPRVWQQLRLEWLFRLLQEPRRLWRRYIIGGFVFLIRAILLRFSHQF